MMGPLSTARLAEAVSVKATGRSVRVTAIVGWEEMQTAWLGRTQ